MQSVKPVREVECNPTRMQEREDPSALRRGAPGWGKVTHRLMQAEVGKRQREILGMEKRISKTKEVI